MRAAQLEAALANIDADDLAAVNTKDAPDRVKPSPLRGATIAGAALEATLPPASWTMIRLRATPAA